MRDRGRLIAPGDLLSGAVLAPGPDALTEPDEGNRSLAELAARYGLRPSSARPSLAFYLVTVWQRRHLILAYATARNVSMYTEPRLGQLWQVLMPLLNSGVYYLIFGVLFKPTAALAITPPTWLPGFSYSPLPNGRSWSAPVRFGRISR